MRVCVCVCVCVRACVCMLPCVRVLFVSTGAQGRNKTSPSIDTSQEMFVIILLMLYSSLVSDR